MRRLKVAEEEEEDFAEMSSISLDEEEELSEEQRLYKDGFAYDDENDSAIDSESFKSEEIVYSTNG